jgi:hypothetical protein
MIEAGVIMMMKTPFQLVKEARQAAPMLMIRDVE